MNLNPRNIGACQPSFSGAGSLSAHHTTRQLSGLHIVAAVHSASSSQSASEDVCSAGIKFPFQAFNHVGSHLSPHLTFQRLNINAASGVFSKMSTLKVSLPEVTPQVSWAVPASTRDFLQRFAPSNVCRFPVPTQRTFLPSLFCSPRNIYVATDGVKIRKSVDVHTVTSQPP